MYVCEYVMPMAVRRQHSGVSFTLHPKAGSLLIFPDALHSAGCLTTKLLSSPVSVYPLTLAILDCWKPTTASVFLCRL